LSVRIFIIAHYFSLSEVGIYSLGYLVAGAIVLFSGAFGMALLFMKKYYFQIKVIFANT